MNFKISYNNGPQSKTVILSAVSMKKARKLFHDIYPEHFAISRVDKEETI